MTSPAAPLPALNVTARRSAHGVTRTESGSLIDNYSKQVTPAPTAPSTPTRDLAGDDDMDVFQYCDRDEAVHDNDTVTASAPHGLATPTATPHGERLSLSASPGDRDVRREVRRLQLHPDGVADIDPIADLYTA